MKAACALLDTLCRSSVRLPQRVIPRRHPRLPPHHLRYHQFRPFRFQPRLEVHVRQPVICMRLAGLLCRHPCKFGEQGGVHYLLCPGYLGISTRRDLYFRLVRYERRVRTLDRNYPGGRAHLGHGRFGRDQFGTHRFLLLRPLHRYSVHRSHCDAQALLNVVYSKPYPRHLCHTHRAWCFLLIAKQYSRRFVGVENLPRRSFERRHRREKWLKPIH